MDPSTLFFALVLVGCLLIGAEIFIPGGVLGFIGGGVLILAIFSGFFAFGPQTGLLAALGIFIFLVITIAFWMWFIPKTQIGKTLTLSDSTAGYTSFKTSSRDLKGKEGIALTPLSPSGLAQIDGRRLDVVAEGSYIDQGATVRVVQVVGNNLAVRAIDTPEKQTE